MTNQALRQEMIQRRKELDQLLKKQKEETIINAIQKDEAYQKAKVVGIFYPMSGEIDLLPLIRDEKTFVIPRVEGKYIHFYPYHPSTELHKSAFGVYEPPKGITMDELIDYLLVPALVISKDLYRLGYGKGFYDRYLLNHRPQHVVGVIYDFQEVDAICTHDMDQKLDRYYKG